MNYRLLLPITLGVLFCLMSCDSTKEDSASLDPDEMIMYCLEQVKKTSDGLTATNRMPRNIEADETEWNTVGIRDWTSGFWPGILWLSYEASTDASFLASSKTFTTALEGVLDRPVGNHDLGFMMHNSFGNGYRLTKDPSYREVVLRAADSLATLFNPKIGTILSWPAAVERNGWPHNTIVDNLMNLELLFWAAKNGGEKSYYDMAVRHAQVSMENLVRPDNSTFHVAVFDTVNGQFLKGVTHQGFADNSMWARGQAWGIYGFTMCYRETGNKAFLETAENLANRFVSMLPEDGVPYWDFNDPSIPDAPKDASAAAIAASAMLELSTLVSSSEEQEKYRTSATKLLTRLSSEDYVSGGKNPSFLMHSTGHKPKGSEINVSINYADYYYLEALLRLQKLENGKKLVSTGG